MTHDELREKVREYRERTGGDPPEKITVGEDVMDTLLEQIDDTEPYDFEGIPLELDISLGDDEVKLVPEIVGD